jgi:glutamine cyclotransferase
MTLITKLFGLGLKNAITRISVILVISLALTNLDCQTGTVANLSHEKSATEKNALHYGYEVVNTFPHDADAYTQGLVFHDGKLLESTGREGKSSLRRVELDTGKVLHKVKIPSPYFAEGITLLKGKVYQLTWQHQEGFIYDAGSFEKTGTFSYQGEGWGLANDGQSLLLSDGTNRIRFLDPHNFQVRKTIAVYDQRTPIARINELEFVAGEIYANIWTEDRIARIDAQTGKVIGWIQLSGLISPSELHDQEAVLNGIAYDDLHGRLFVTGKLWPKLFEIRLKRQ